MLREAFGINLIKRQEIKKRKIGTHSPLPYKKKIVSKLNRALYNMKRLRELNTHPYYFRAGIMW